MAEAYIQHEYLYDVISGPMKLTKTDRLPHANGIVANTGLIQCTSPRAVH